MSVIEHPEKKGRGPAFMNRHYVVITDQDDEFKARFVGVVHGTTKGADLLVFDDNGLLRTVHYRNLVDTLRLERCPSCNRPNTFRRLSQEIWECDICGHAGVDDPRPRRRRRR